MVQDVWKHELRGDYYKFLDRYDKELKFGDTLTGRSGDQKISKSEKYIFVSIVIFRVLGLDYLGILRSESLNSNNELKAHYKSFLNRYHDQEI